MSALTFERDPVGFPMVWIEQVDAYVHWLPVTKIQFEHFLCDVSENSFDAAWYDQVLRLNPRVAPREVTERNYWRAFITGVQPAEAERFARWCGEDYGLPTAEEWVKIYQAIRDLPPEPLDWTTLSSRANTLLSQMDRAGERAAAAVAQPRTRVGQMLMRLGVMEWVEDVSNGYRWGGLGQLHPDFHGLLFSPDHGKPARPNHPETDRLFYYGFRLLRRRR